MIEEKAIRARHETIKNDVYERYRRMSPTQGRRLQMTLSANLASIG